MCTSASEKANRRSLCVQWCERDDAICSPKYLNSAGHFIYFSHSRIRFSSAHLQDIVRPISQPAALPKDTHHHYRPTTYLLRVIVDHGIWNGLVITSIMACATLKRSLDWESINQRPSKRRRCTPFGSSRHSMSSPHMNKRRLYSQMNDSLDGTSSMSPYSVPLHATTSTNLMKPEDQQMFTGNANGQQMFHSQQQQHQMQGNNEGFPNTDLQQFDPALSADSQVNAFPKITPEKMAQHVQEEIQRMANRRKQLQYQVSGLLVNFCRIIIAHALIIILETSITVTRIFDFVVLVKIF